MRFCSLFVLPCPAVLVPGGAFWWQQPSIHQFPQVFSSSRIPEVTLESFSVRFCGLFVLPCPAVLVPGGAFGILLSAVAAAAAAPAAAAAGASAAASPAAAAAATAAA